MYRILPVCIVYTTISYLYLIERKPLPRVQFHIETCKSEVEKLKCAEDLEISNLDIKEREVDQEIRDFDDMVTEGRKLFN